MLPFYLFIFSSAGFAKTNFAPHDQEISSFVIILNIFFFKFGLINARSIAFYTFWTANIF